jgi:hypothetical protein
MQFFSEGIFCGAPSGHSECLSPSENQDKLPEASCQGGPRHADKEVGLRLEEQEVEC